MLPPTSINIKLITIFFRLMSADTLVKNHTPAVIVVSDLPKEAMFAHTKSYMRARNLSLAGLITVRNNLPS